MPTGAATETAAEKLDEVERDKDSNAERTQPTPELLWPKDGFKDRFSLTVSRRVFDGWVTQPSPCCAAASVAGACNIVLGLRAMNEADAPLSHSDVAAIMHGMISEHLAKRHASVCRLLGVPSCEPAFDALRANLAAEGRSLGGQKELGCKPKEALERLRLVCVEQMAKEAAAAAAATAGSDGACTPSEPNRLWVALLECLPEAPAAAAPAGAPASAPDCEEEQEEEEEEETLLSGGKGGGTGADNFGLKVRKELKTLINKLTGSEQLGPQAARLHTSMIGNWGIRGAIKELSEAAYLRSLDPRLKKLQQWHAEATGDGANGPPTSAVAVMADAPVPVASVELSEKENESAQPSERSEAPSAAEGACLGGSTEDAAAGAAASGAVALIRGLATVRAKTLMSKRIKGAPAPPITVKANDGEKEIDDAWQAFKVAFGREGTALIVHHKNHYSLVFALREWTEAEGTAVREVLTARKGQRPTAWVPWDEIHGLIARWAGYAVIQVSREV